MTGDEDQILHAWVISGDSPMAFFTDVCKMLQLAVDSCDGAITTDNLSHPATQSTHFLVRVQGTRALARLAEESGVHRSQIVPAQSATGKVETVLIGVELLASVDSPHTARPKGPVLKTYNYPLGNVTFHVSGRTQRLDVVLRGEG